MSTKESSPVKKKPRAKKKREPENIGTEQERSPKLQKEQQQEKESQQAQEMQQDVQEKQLDQGSKAQGSKAEVKPEFIQPVMNIGLVGHVDHGKTTLTERLSGKWTDTHSEEIRRGITIRLGYASATFYQCPTCEEPQCYSVKPVCQHCQTTTQPLRKISFVDAPGHESLMATMLSGAALMDGALLLVSANEHCPQPQTREHLMALTIVGIKHIVVVQNKIDLVSKQQALANYAEIKAFLKGTPYENAPIVPISAQHSLNIDVLIHTMQQALPNPVRGATQDPLFFVARSFDINRPGTSIPSIRGGVLGGALAQGKLVQGQEIEIRPGYMVEEQNKQVWKSLTTTIVSLNAGDQQLQELVPGGTAGILTTLDPSIVKSDKLSGNVVGIKGKLPNVLNDISLQIHLLERVVGTKEDLSVEPLKLGEALMLNVNAAATVGIVTALRKHIISCRLKLPLCAYPGSRVTISRRIGNRFRLIGYGILQ